MEAPLEDDWGLVADDPLGLGVQLLTEILIQCAPGLFDQLGELLVLPVVVMVLGWNMSQ